MTVGGHFERVAAIYESLRTTNRRRYARSASSCPAAPSPASISAAARAGTHGCCALCCRTARGWPPATSRRPCWHSSRPPASATPMRWPRCWQRPKNCHCGPPAWTWSPRSTAFTTSTSAGSWPPPPGCCSPAASCSSTPAPRSRTRERSGVATSPVSPSTSSACTARPRSGTPSGGPTGSRWPPHRPSAPAHQHGRAAPGPGRGPPLLDIRLLHAAGAARSHRGLPGPPAQPRSVLD